MKNITPTSKMVLGKNNRDYFGNRTTTVICNGTFICNVENSLSRFLIPNNLKFNTAITLTTRNPSEK